MSAGCQGTERVSAKMTLTLRPFLLSAIALASLAAISAAEDAPESHAKNPCDGLHAATRRNAGPVCSLARRQVLYVQHVLACGGRLGKRLAGDQQRRRTLAGLRRGDSAPPREVALQPGVQVLRESVWRPVCHGFRRLSGKVGTEIQDTLCFYQSQDLIHWKHAGESHADARWYLDTAAGGRWDHMYVLPKKEGNPKAGYWGWVVANPKPASALGTARSG